MAERIFIPFVKMLQLCEVLQRASDGFCKVFLVHKLVQALHFTAYTRFTLDGEHLQVAGYDVVHL